MILIYYYTSIVNKMCKHTKHTKHTKYTKHTKHTKHTKCIKHICCKKNRQNIYDNHGKNITNI